MVKYFSGSTQVEKWLGRPKVGSNFFYYIVGRNLQFTSNYCLGKSEPEIDNEFADAVGLPLTTMTTDVLDGYKVATVKGSQIVFVKRMKQQLSKRRIEDRVINWVVTAYDNEMKKPEEDRKEDGFMDVLDYVGEEKIVTDKWRNQFAEFMKDARKWAEAAGNPHKSTTKVGMGKKRPYLPGETQKEKTKRIRVARAEACRLSVFLIKKILKRKKNSLKITDAEIKEAWEEAGFDKKDLGSNAGNRLRQVKKIVEEY